jgi:hypothetical protein
VMTSLDTAALYITFGRYDDLHGSNYIRRHRRYLGLPSYVEQPFLQ